jgi:Cytochrome c oxidase subunit IV
VRSFVALFACAAGFGTAIAVAYWFIAHEEATGTALLTLMAIALAFAAGYAIIAERNAALEGDNPDEPPEAMSGEDVGSFTTHSAWPILVAVCALGTLVGVLWSPLLGVAGLVVLVLCLWRLGAESART